MKNRKEEWNQAKVLDALDHAGSALPMKGLTREDLMKIAEFHSRNTLRKYLRNIRHLLFERKEKDGKTRIYLKSHFERFKTDELHMPEAWGELSKQMFDWAQEKRLIPIDMKYWEFFQNHAVLLYPEKTGHPRYTFVERFVFCSFEKCDSGPQAFQLKLLWDI
jgi:hypothetical protein